MCDMLSVVAEGVDRRVSLLLPSLDGCTEALMGLWAADHGLPALPHLTHCFSFIAENNFMVMCVFSAGKECSLLFTLSLWSHVLFR